MKLTKLKIKSFKFKDNLNIDYSPYYKIIDSIYQFYDKKVKFTMMFKYGIDCGFNRRIQNNKVIYECLNKPLTQDQLEFQRKRALINLNDSNLKLGVSNACSCKKRQE